MKDQSGLTLIELLAVVAIIGISLGIASLYLRPIEAPLKSGASLVEGFLREARTSAIATTTARRVRPLTSNRFAAEYAASCSATSWTPASGATINLPQAVTANSITWSVCFSSRGISDGNQTITLQHPQFGSIGIEVMVGGTTRVIDG